MKTKLLISLLLLGLVFGSKGQPATEVILFDLHLSTDSVYIKDPLNVSRYQGYDNQPFFIPGTSALLYTSQRGDQTEIIRYDINSDKHQQITNSPGGEYSPTITPDLKSISTIILEASGRQLLWRYAINGEDPVILVPDLKIGYHCWLTDEIIAAYVLGDPNTLQICNLLTGKNSIIASNIGRSLHRIPGTHLLSFIDKNDPSWTLQSYDLHTGTLKPLIDGLQGSEDMAWAPDGTLFMGQGSKLFKWNPQQDDDWALVAELKSHGYEGITRLAINQKGDRLAIVVTEPE